MLKTFDYIKCFENTFWSWDTEERFVHVKDGITFSHWDEVVAYLTALEPMGLPLFDVFMGILAASTTGEFNSVSESIKSQLLPKSKTAEMKAQLMIFDTIAQVEEKYKKGENRFLLISTILEKSNVKFIELTSSRIIEDLNDHEKDFFGTSALPANNHTRKVINCFTALEASFPSPESIVEAMMGFDLEKLNLVNIIPRNNDKVPEEGTSLLDELKNEVRTEKMAALIPHVLAGMNFPIHSTESDTRPEGGVSDLSNKGHFDQLIVSEFAYDDDYFLSRIVNNEALFYQHEKAKDEHDNDLCVLIDASLYMWGLPKLIATAIGCTIGLKEEKSEFDCFFVGDELVLCDFRTLEGVLKGTRFANASICPAEGLQRFIDEERTYSNTLFVTTPDSWKRPEMIQIKEDSKQLFDFLVFVNEKAEINIQKSKGKQVTNFKLDLKTIWELKKGNKKEIVVPVTREYPILFPIFNNRCKYFFSYGEDHYFIDKSKGLFHYTPNKEITWLDKGARFIRKLAPELDILGDIGLNDQGQIELLMFDRKNRLICIYNLADKTEKVYHFLHWKSRYGTKFYHENNQFNFVCVEGSWMIDGSFDYASEMMPFDERLNREAKTRNETIKIPGRGFQPYLKNINSVYLSTQGELVIKNKRIDISVENDLQFWEAPIGKMHYLPEASKVGERRFFKFDSGELITTNPSGMLEFQFGDSHQPEGFELTLSKVADNRLATVSTLKTITGKGLKTCKEFIDDHGGSVAISSDLKKLNTFADDLRKIGNTVEIKALVLGKHFYMTTLVEVSPALASNSFFTGNEAYRDESCGESQRMITTIEFYDLYLKAFIENIQNGV